MEAVALPIHTITTILKTLAVITTITRPAQYRLRRSNQSNNSAIITISKLNSSLLLIITKLKLIKKGRTSINLIISIMSMSLIKVQAEEEEKTVEQEVMPK